MTSYEILIIRASYFKTRLTLYTQFPNGEYLADFLFFLIPGINLFQLSKPFKEICNILFTLVSSDMIEKYMQICS